MDIGSTVITPALGPCRDLAGLTGSTGREALAGDNAAMEFPPVHKRDSPSAQLTLWAPGLTQPLTAK